MKSIIIILSALILFGCASSTVIKTIPDGAKVKQGGQLLGITPYDLWDRGGSFESTTFTLQMAGYKDKEITIIKDVFYFHRLIFPPILALPWLFGYAPQYSFELENSEQTTTQRTSPKNTANSNLETQSNSVSAQKLRELKRLKDEGHLTDIEYEQKRKAIVEGM